MNRIVVLFFLFLVVGCNTRNDVPNGILPPQKMQQVMWDMMQVDGLVAYSYDTLIKKPGKRTELYYTVLSNYKISQEEFRENMQFYQTRPDLLKIVFDSLQQMALRDTAKIVLDTPKVIKDTLIKDSAKSQLDTVNSSLDTSKRRKLPIERIKALQKIRPV
jgi:Domain of unknown function (DUF4296)